MRICDCSICLLFHSNNPLATQLSTSSFYRILTGPYSSFAKGILSPILDDPQSSVSLVRTKSSVVTGPDQEQCCHWSGHSKCRSLIQSCMLPHAIPSPIHCSENLISVFPEKELRGLSSNFNIYVSVSDLYIPRIRTHIFLQQNR